MKIAAKISLTAFTALLGLGFASTSVMAQVAPGPETGSIQVGVMDSGDSMNSEDMGSPAVPSSVKNVVKRLNHATKDITLEDLNSAREAVVKLDVLIDIEKRLNDLMSLRKEREESIDGLSASLPDTALAGMPPAIPVMSAPMPIMSAPSPMPSSSALDEIEVLRISGASGRYSAMVQSSDGSEQMVRVGDKLSDGSKVLGISRKGVTFKAGSKKRTIQVKDAGTLFTNK